MWSVIYIGYSADILRNIMSTTYFSLRGVVGVKGRISDEYLDIVKANNIAYLELNRKEDMESLDEFCANIDIILMYKFEFLLSKSFVKKYSIFNFHGGDLRTNRGAHAVVWSVLNNDAETCLSLYKLTGGIDEGEIIGEYWVKLEEEETVITLNSKLVKGIPNLFEELRGYLLGMRKSHLVIGGIYRRKIQESDYTIDVMHDSICKIKAIIRSQYTYGGAVCFWEGKKWGVKRYTHYLKNEFVEREIVAFNDGVQITDGNECLRIFFED